MTQHALPLPLVGLPITLLVTAISDADKIDVLRNYQADQALNMAAALDKARSAFAAAGIPEPDIFHRAVNASRNFAQTVQRDRLEPDGVNTIFTVGHALDEIDVQRGLVRGKLDLERENLDTVQRGTPIAFADLHAAEQRQNELRDRAAQALADSGCTTTTLTDVEPNGTLANDQSP
jgi:hypothetical protein